MKLKYVIISNGRNYLYQRRFPKRLLAHPQITQPIYKKAMGVKVGSSDEEILAAHSYAHKAYEDFVRVLFLANSELLEQAEMIRLADSIVASNKLLKAGMLHRDPMLSEEQWKAVFEENMNNLEASGAVDSVLYRHREQAAGDGPLAPMTPEQTIESLVAKIVSEPAGPKGRISMPMLSDCWEPYRDLKGIDAKTADGARKLFYWTQFIEFAGDSIMTADAVQDGVELYADKLIKTGVKGTTVETRLKINLAIIRHSIKQRRLPIVVVKPEIKGGSDYADDYVLNAGEEQALMALLGAMKPSWKTATLALMLETGCYASELQRLDEFNVHLDDPIPHIILKNKTMKTKSRPRVLTPISPTTLRLLRGQLFTRGWINFQANSGSGNSSSLSRIIQKVAPLGTARSLRHGTRNRLMAAGIPFDLQALIGGWSAGLNTVQMGYGRAGVTNERTLVTLQTALRKANGNMEPTGTQDNVIQIGGVK